MFDQNIMGSNNIKYGYNFPDGLKHFSTVLDETFEKRNEIIEVYLKSHTPHFDKSLFTMCSHNDYKLPCSLNRNDYQQDEDEMILTHKITTNDFTKFYAQNEEHLKQTYTKSVKSSNISQEEFQESFNKHCKEVFTSTKNEHDKTHNYKLWDFINQKMDIYNEEKTWFLFWIPRDATKYHMKILFWFFVRVNVVMQLLRKNDDNSLLSKYLKQILLGCIPYIILLDEFYYDRDITDHLLNEYSSNFNLECEFCSDVEVKTEFVGKIPTTLFQEIYTSDQHEFEISEIYKKFTKRKLKSGSNGYRIRDALLATIRSSSRPNDIFCIIPLFQFFVENDFEVQDSEFSLIHNIHIFPIEMLPKSQVFFDVFNPRYKEFDEENIDDSLESGKQLYSTFVLSASPLGLGEPFKDFSKNFVKYYKRNGHFANYVNKAIYYSLTGNYKWAKINNVSDYRLLKGGIKIYKKLPKLIKKFMRKKDKNKYSWMEIILHENILYIAKNTPQILNFIFLGNKKKVSHFEKQVIRNANTLRKRFYRKKNKKNFKKIKRINKKKDHFDCISKSLEDHISMEYVVKSVLNMQIPLSDSTISIYNYEDMNKVFGYDWIDKINRVCLEWENCQGKFHRCREALFSNFGRNLFTDKDEKGFKEIFDDMLVSGVDKLDITGRSILYFGIKYLVEKSTKLAFHKLPKLEIYYRTMLNTFREYPYLKFAHSTCCDVPHNCTDGDYGYSNITMKTMFHNGFECIKHKEQKRKLDPLLKYNDFARRTNPFIKKIVKLVGLTKAKRKYYKKILDGESDAILTDDDDDNNENRTAVNNEHRLIDFLSKEQLDSIKRNCDENEDVEFLNEFEWEETNDVIGYVYGHISKLNKLTSFLKKMCKWKRNFFTFNTKEISFYNPFKFLFEMKSRGNKFTLYKLCLSCDRVMEFNPSKSFDYYDYCCEDCEEIEEKLERTLIIDTSQKDIMARISIC